MSDQIQYILPAPFLSLPSVYLIPVTPAANQVLAWSADGSAIVMRPVTSSMLTDFGSAVGSIVTSSVAALNLGSAATHAATDFATPASVSTAIGALNLASASTHPASDFATPGGVTASINSAISAIVNLAPAQLDTLGEIATQLASDESTAAALTTVVAGKLAKASNLSDLASASTARTNLGLGTAATAASSSFAATANNLSDLASAPTARTNLGLGTAATQNTGTGANQIVTRDGSGSVVGQVTARQQTDAEIAALTPAAGELLQSTTDPTKLSIGDGTTAGGLAIGTDVRTLAWNVTPAPTSGSMNVVYVYTDTRTAGSQQTYANLPLPQKVGQRVTVVIQVASGHSAYSHAFTFGGAQVSFRNASGGLVTLDGGLNGSLTSGKNFYLLSLLAVTLTDWLIESTNFSTAELQAAKDNNDS